MSILSFIRRVCVQPAVYWEYAGTDEFSSPKFYPPRQIKVRWDESTEVVSDSNGREFMSHAQVIVPENLKEKSYLWLGDQINDLPPDPIPVELEGAFEIKKMDRHPLFRSSTFDVFMAYM